MTVVVILVIIGLILYYFFRDRDKMLETQVDSEGGMQNKYSLLIDWLTNHPDARITKVRRDYVQISMIGQTTATYFSITENFEKVEVEWDARLDIMGNHRLYWSFASRAPQQIMIEKISKDLERYENEVFNDMPSSNNGTTLINNDSSQTTGNYLEIAMQYVDKSDFATAFKILKDGSMFSHNKDTDFMLAELAFALDYQDEIQSLMIRLINYKKHNELNVIQEKMFTEYLSKYQKRYM